VNRIVREQSRRRRRLPASEMEKFVRGGAVSERRGRMVFGRACLVGNASELREGLWWDVGGRIGDAPAST
jgi:hypothetical protein